MNEKEQKYLRSVGNDGKRTEVPRVEQLEFNEDEFNVESPFDLRPKNIILPEKKNTTMRGIGERRKLIYLNLFEIQERFPVEQTIIDLKVMTPYERQRTLNEIREYIIPKLQRTEVVTDQEVERVIVVQLPKVLKEVEREVARIDGKAIDARVESE